MLVLNVCIQSLTKKESEKLENIIKKTKITPDIINVGGGFPFNLSRFTSPQPLEDYISEIKKAFDNLKLENKPNYYVNPVER